MQSWIDDIIRVGDKIKMVIYLSNTTIPKFHGLGQIDGLFKRTGPY